MREVYYIFGGTFDPMHEGHIGVIRELLSQNKKIVIAPTAVNPLKQAAKVSFNDRLEMIKDVLKFESIEFGNSPDSKVFLCDFAYTYVCDFVDWWKSKYSTNLIWVIGPDLVEQVKSWKNWDKLNIGTYVSKNYANDLHSTDIRNSKKAIHPALRHIKFYSLIF